MAKFHTENTDARKPTRGMSRFFSQPNLDRYRQLASGVIGETEQRKLLEDLAQEMNTFRREARAEVNGLPSLGASPQFSVLNKLRPRQHWIVTSRVTP